MLPLLSRYLILEEWYKNSWQAKRSNLKVLYVRDLDLARWHILFFFKIAHSKINWHFTWKFIIIKIIFNLPIFIFHSNIFLSENLLFSIYRGNDCSFFSFEGLFFFMFPQGPRFLMTMICRLEDLMVSVLYFHSVIHNGGPSERAMLICHSKSWYK